MRILLIGHSCSPVRGSEPGKIFHHAWHVAQHHPTWLIVHPQYKSECDKFFQSNHRENLHIHWLELPRDRDPWDPDKGEAGVRRHYLIYQRFAAELATQIVREHRIDIVHHVSWGTVNAPPRLAHLNVPIVWGAIGGGETMPWAFRRYFAGAMKRELLRIAMNRALPFSPTLRKMARKSVCLVTNDETRSVLARAGATQFHPALDVGVRTDLAHGATSVRDSSGPMTLLWAGRCEPRKALPLALEAMAKCKHRDVRLRVAGDGESRAGWEQIAQELGVHERVEFLGNVQFQQMTELFATSHAFIFTSLRDLMGSVMIEAQAHGLPIITLDHNGARNFMNPRSAIKVPVTRPDRTVAGLADAIDRFASDPDLRQTMGANGIADAHQHDWEKRAKLMLWIYDLVLRGTRFPLRTGDL
jgi:glycosyltransferase involved in cell wall biosynthesis